jgi:hypothetical protein
MESGRFTRFSKNGSFGKPGILRGDQGRSPPFSILSGSKMRGFQGKHTREAGIRVQNFSSMIADRPEKF